MSYHPISALSESLPVAPLLDGAAALSAHAALVAALRQPGAIGPAAGEVGLLDMPLSSLLLVGALVYKLMKPLRHGRLDFSTLAARQEACEQALRLNRRTAPRHCLAVVAVRQTADGPRITGPGAGGPTVGPVIDWALQMRRFDDSQRLDRLAQAGALTPAMIDSLADAVARFHSQLSPAPPGFGRSEPSGHWARETADELLALLAACGAPDGPQALAVAALQHWLAATGARLAGLMGLRCRTGHVREVHGDLHLAHIVWVDGAPLLFDALAHNDTLRHTDTVGDLAFVYMDLLAQGLPRLAWRFISAALEASGDHAALPLLAWWAVLRAMGRAKAMLLAAQAAPDSTGPLPRTALASANAYLGLALTLAGLPGPGAHGVPAPPALRLVLACGLSGAGKSTVAGLLAPRIGAVRLRADVERKRLFAAPPLARAVPGLYSADANRRTYERLAELAALTLAAGVAVVVDAASLRRSERDAMRAVAAQHGAAFTLLLCQAPTAVLQARLHQRQLADDDPSDATPQVLAFQQQIAEWPGADEAADSLHLNTDVSRDELVVQVAALA